ncbi:hypothetical protein EVAR_68119_1 [Eumeta japonica]|uniref:Uncharacterized protein n=1 Tax=Eumeta variegata TaxID=151549 RepID=A0A4C1ZBA0_EUMVA|nr:hypothetical protein EVAR_68119_1 [Eumeta japonica]
MSAVRPASFDGGRTRPSPVLLCGHPPIILIVLFLWTGSAYALMRPIIKENAHFDLRLLSDNIMEPITKKGSRALRCPQVTIVAGSPRPELQIGVDGSRPKCGARNVVRELDRLVKAELEMERKLLGDTRPARAVGRGAGVRAPELDAKLSKFSQISALAPRPSARSIRAALPAPARTAPPRRPRPQRTRWTPNLTTSSCPTRRWMILFPR